jgi:hypothetical protein
MVINKRVHPRITLKIPVKYRLIEDQEEIKTVREGPKKGQTSQTMDVSMGGMYLVADQIPSVGSVLWLELTLPKLSRAVSAYAEVIWVNATGGGLHFEVVQEEDFEVLKDYFSQAPVVGQLGCHSEEQSR